VEVWWGEVNLAMSLRWERCCFYSSREDEQQQSKDLGEEDVSLW